VPKRGYRFIGDVTATGGDEESVIVRGREIDMVDDLSSTVKDLVAGSGINFEDRGVHVLAGCGEWRLFKIQRTQS
jgi:hypothetical protein